MRNSNFKSKWSAAGLMRKKPIFLVVFTLCMLLLGLIYDENSILNPKYCYAQCDELINWKVTSGDWRAGSRVVHWDGKHCSAIIDKYGSPDIEAESYDKNKVWIYDSDPSTIFHICPTNRKIVKTYVIKKRNKKIEL